jgi:pimeloyl-ACP methyl ester carboxylesterase
MSGAHHVTSVDGTPIGYATSGTGPPLVMVHGATADHTALSRVIPLLETHYTVHAVDRRGRGLSGDRSPYDITLEYADVARVVDQVARETGGTVSLYGHSYGAICALGAATATPNVGRLFLYEPGYQGVVLTPDTVLARLDELVADGAYDAALEHAYRFGVGMSADEVAAMRALPSWQSRVAAARTIPREFRTAANLPFDATAVADLHVPTVLLLGDRSTTGQAAVVAALHSALLRSDVVVLPGQAHAAQVTAPDLVADALRRPLSVAARACGERS